jgi:hypothetical protein
MKCESIYSVVSFLFREGGGGVLFPGVSSLNAKVCIFIDESVRSVKCEDGIDRVFRKVGI